MSGKIYRNQQFTLRVQSALSMTEAADVKIVTRAPSGTVTEHDSPTVSGDGLIVSKKIQLAEAGIYKVWLRSTWAGDVIPSTPADVRIFEEGTK